MVLLVATAIVIVVLALAWADGGRREQRLIVQPVATSEPRA